MTTLWGNKTDNKDSDDQPNGEGASMARNSEEGRREPTERDRLLGDSQGRQGARADGYLDPDDPAVSPAPRSCLPSDEI